MHTKCGVVTGQLGRCCDWSVRSRVGVVPINRFGREVWLTLSVRRCLAKVVLYNHKFNVLFNVLIVWFKPPAGASSFVQVL